MPKYTIANSFPTTVLSGICESDLEIDSSAVGLPANQHQVYLTGTEVCLSGIRIEIFYIAGMGHNCNRANYIVWLNSGYTNYINLESYGKSNMNNLGTSMSWAPPYPGEIIYTNDPENATYHNVSDAGPYVQPTGSTGTPIYLINDARAKELVVDTAPINWNAYIGGSRYWRYYISGSDARTLASGNTSNTLKINMQYQSGTHPTGPTPPSDEHTQAARCIVTKFFGSGVSSIIYDDTVTSIGSGLNLNACTGEIQT